MQRILADTPRAIRIPSCNCSAIFMNMWRPEISRRRRNFLIFKTGHQELLICEAITKSAQKRAWVKVPQE